VSRTRVERVERAASGGGGACGTCTTRKTVDGQLHHVLRDGRVRMEHTDVDGTTEVRVDAPGECPECGRDLTCIRIVLHEVEPGVDIPYLRADEEVER